MTKADIATRLRDLSRQINELGREVVGDLQVDGQELAEEVTKVFDGQEASNTQVTPNQQRQAAQQFEQQQMKTTPCKFCGAPIYFQQSAKTGNWYTTNSPRKNDLHNCPNRPA